MSLKTGFYQQFLTSSLFVDQQGLNFDFDSSNEPKRMSFREYRETEVFNTRGYIENLRKEITEWKDLMRKQKNELNSLSESYRNKQEQSFDLSILSASDRAFLNDGPNYEEFLSQVQELRKVAIKVAYLNLQNSELETNLTKLLESEIEDASVRVIKLID